MAIQHKLGFLSVQIVLCALAMTADLALPPLGSAWGRPLTSSEKDALDELKKKKAEKKEAEKKEAWDTARETAKDAFFWVLDQAIDKVFKPLEVVPVSGPLIDKIKPSGRGIYRYFVEDPWMKETHHRYTTILSNAVNATFKQRNTDKAELDRINRLLNNVADDDAETKQLLEDERRRLNRQIDAADEVIDGLNLRIDAADRAKKLYDEGGDIPAGFPKLLKDLNNEIKEMQDRKKRRMAEPEDEVEKKPSCKDLKHQEVEIERKLYAEFQQRRNDPGMVLEAQRAQNEKMKLQAQMATCSD